MKLKLLLFFSLFAVSVIAQTANTENRIPVSEVIQLPVKSTGDFTEVKALGPCIGNEGTIQLVNCTAVGTPAFTALSLTDEVDNEPFYITDPMTACGSGNIGSWHQYDIANNVDQVVVSYDGNLAIGAVFSQLTMAFYQGTDCNNLTEIGCGTVVQGFLDGGGNLFFEFYDIILDNIDDSQPLWVYSFGNDIYNADFNFIGTSNAPANDQCSGASTDAFGCNLGASPATGWNGPNNNGQMCDGGTWHSNENTVFYSFEATAANGTIDVQNVVCNDGVVGEAQFGVWKNCASVGTYGSDFVGCAVGVGTLNMPALTIGETYVIAVDGQAGDVCTWEFVTSGTSLPVEMKGFKGINQIDHNKIEWVTLSERNSDYFILERSSNGVDFEFVDQIEAVGNSTSISDYVAFDYDFEQGNNYYRLLQYDLDGNKEIYGPILINNSSDDLISIFPNPVSEKMNIHFDSKVGKNDVLEITDMSGRVIETISTLEANFNKVIIDVDQYQAGVYLVNLRKDSGIIEQHKVIVK